MSDEIILRRARLLTRDYKVVKDVVVPRDREWPGAVRYEGRVFMLYPKAYALTIEALKHEDQEQLYMEMDLWDAGTSPT